MVLLGHLHTHEFAAGGTTDQVGNPWALDRSAGGSSGGSGAALAARMTPAATGTDTAGSLRIPSAFCGTSTIKPTRGLVSMRGIVPLAESLDHAGPMARTVEDCALLLAGMAGVGGPVEPRPLAGLRLGVSSRIGELDADVAAGFEATLAALPRPRRGARRGAARAGDARRLGSRAPERHARLPPPLRRPARALPPVDPPVRRARRGARAGRLRRPAGAASPRRRALGAVVRRGAGRRAARADRPRRRLAARLGLRRGRQRHRVDLAHPPLGLDGPAGRRAAGAEWGPKAGCR